MAEMEKKVNRIVYYPGEKPVLSTAEKMAIKEKSRLIILTVILVWFSLAIGVPTIVTVGKKLFGMTPILY